MFTIKTTQKLLRTSGDPAQEMIDSQVMGLEAVHLMEKEALMEQDQLGLQAMALDQTVGIPALVLLMGLEAQATVVTGEQGMAQLVAQVLVMETVLTVAIPAAVLLTAPEAQATVVTVEQGMEQVTLVAAQVEMVEMVLVLMAVIAAVVLVMVQVQATVVTAAMEAVQALETAAAMVEARVATEQIQSQK